MSAIDIDILRSILHDHVEPDKEVEILREINKALVEEEQAKADEEKPPKIEKKPVVILTALPRGLEAKDLESLCGFITEIALETPTREIETAVVNVKEAYKSSKKAKKNPAESLGDLFELAPTKLFKEEGILKKPKGPLEFVHCPNR